MNLKDVEKVKILLQSTARVEGVVPFAKLFACFSKEVKPYDVYNGLEIACFEICGWKTAIYSALLAKNENGLPGDGFFDIYRNHREVSYSEIAGNTHVAALNLKQRQAMTRVERVIVYQHAKFGSM